MKKKFNWSSITSNLWLIAIILFIYVPIIYVVVFSFNSTKSLNHFSGFSLQWYRKMFSDRTMLDPIKYTVIIALIATAVSTVVGTISAIGLSKQNKIFREIILQINNLPMTMPDVVTAIGLMLLFTSLSIKTSFWTLLIAHIAFCIPYVILSIMPKLRSLDDNIAEAAMDLGATPLQALTKVIIPQIVPSIVSGALIAFSMSFDDFVISFFTTGTGVSNISIYVYSMSKRINPSINALSSIIVLIVTTVLILVNVVPVVKAKKAEKEQLTGVKQKSFLKPALAGAMAVCILAVAIFAGKGSSSEFDPIAAFGADTINVFNSGEYIGEEVVSRFEDMYNVTVNYDTFDSNEAMYTKLLSGASYDVVIPSDYMIEKLLELNMLQPIDKSIVVSLDNLCDGVRDLSFDPDNDYSVPYFWGTVGIIYDTTVVDSEDVESLGWDVFRLEKYAGDIYFYDNERDSFMVALKALGYSANTDNMDEINEAFEWLVEMKRTMNPAIVTDEVIDGVINGEKSMAYVYSGDAAYMISENEDLAYYEPHQGTNIWNDSMVIPANAEHYTLANVFIEYLLEYEQAYESSDYVGYTSMRQDVIDDLSGEDGTYFEIDAYIPRDDYELDEHYHNNEVLRKTISELWVKVRMTKSDNE